MGRHSADQATSVRRWRQFFCRHRNTYTIWDCHHDEMFRNDRCHLEVCVKCIHVVNLTVSKGFDSADDIPADWATS